MTSVEINTVWVEYHGETLVLKRTGGSSSLLRRYSPSSREQAQDQLSRLKITA